jgi:hypothetical protein
MKIKINFLILTFCLVCNLRAQEKYKISWDYKDLSFKEFVTKAESLFPVKFYYKDSWVTGLKLSDYSGCTTLSCVLDNLFKETLLYYYIDDSGNVVITANYAVKDLVAPSEIENNVIPKTQYANYEKDQKAEEITSAYIGNPAERNRPGNVTVSGYIRSKDTREATAGVTIIIQKLSIGTITNEFGFYTLTLPRGIHLIQFSFFGMREKKSTCIFTEPAK